MTRVCCARNVQLIVFFHARQGRLDFLQTTVRTALLLHFGPVHSLSGEHISVHASPLPQRVVSTEHQFFVMLCSSKMIKHLNSLLFIFREAAAPTLASFVSGPSRNYELAYEVLAMINVAMATITAIHLLCLKHQNRPVDVP
jgi:hypothetical protein